MSSSHMRTSETAFRRRLIYLAMALVLLIGAVFAFRGAGRWLVSEDALDHADAVVVLSGSMPYRAEEAAKIFGMGYAPEVWISRPENASAELSAMGIQYRGEEDYNRDVLIHGGVPELVIHIFPEPIVNTEQEIELIVHQMQQEKKTSVIIVTSPQHTRRVRALWRRLADKNIKITVHAAPEDPFDRDHWWRNTRDALSVSREMLGLLNAWAGLPVRPRFIYVK